MNRSVCHCDGFQRTQIALYLGEVTTWSLFFLLQGHNPKVNVTTAVLKVIMCRSVTLFCLLAFMWVSHPEGDCVYNLIRRRRSAWNVRVSFRFENIKISFNNTVACWDIITKDEGCGWGQTNMGEGDAIKKMMLTFNLCVSNGE